LDETSARILLVEDKPALGLTLVDRPKKEDARHHRHTRSPARAAADGFRAGSVARVPRATRHDRIAAGNLNDGVVESQAQLGEYEPIMSREVGTLSGPWWSGCFSSWPPATAAIDTILRA